MRPVVKPLLVLVLNLLATHSLSGIEYLSERKEVQSICPLFDRRNGEEVRREVSIQVTPNTKPEYCVVIRTESSGRVTAISIVASARLIPAPAVPVQKVDAQLVRRVHVLSTEQQASIERALDTGIQRLSVLAVKNSTYKGPFRFMLDNDEIKVTVSSFSRKLVFLEPLPYGDVDLTTTTVDLPNWKWLEKVFRALK